MKFNNDPIGLAIHEFSNGLGHQNIIVKSDLCEDDLMPIPYLFRNYNEMPELEKVALKHCKGKVLDIGACTGCHSKYLDQQGLEVVAVEKSAGAASYLRQNDIHVVEDDFMQLEEGSFDTILLLMNGMGLAGTLERLPLVLQHLKSLISPTGKILCDSTDIAYMYENEDGSMWMDLTANYYGEMQFNMIYKDQESGWFPWLYVDPLKLTEYATSAGFDVEILYRAENNHYLAALNNE